MRELDALRALGLTRHQALAYRALLQLGLGTAYQVARVASLPAANTYAALARLAELGGAELLPGRPRRYRPAEPDTWLPELAGRLQSQAREAAATLKSLATRVQPEGREEGELTGAAASRALRQRIEAAHSLLAVEATPSQIEQAATQLQAAGRRGLQVALLVCGEGGRPRGFVPPAGWLLGGAEEAPGSYEALWVCDGRQALRTAGAGAGLRARLLVDGPYAQALTRGILARIGWGADAGTGIPAEPSAAQKRILRLLRELPGL